MNNSSSYDSLKLGSGSSLSSLKNPDFTRLNPVPPTGVSTSHTDIFVSQQPGRNDPKSNSSINVNIQREQQIQGSYFMRGSVEASTSGNYGVNFGFGKKF